MSLDLPSPEPTGEPHIALDPARFEERLQVLLALETIGAVRSAIPQVREEWLASERAAEGDEQALSLPPEFLGQALDQISQALTIERARYYIERLRRLAGEPRTNGVNDIDLNRWKTYADIRTDSLWQIDRRDTSSAHTAGYWGNFIPQIPNQMMQRYTRKGGWVLDAFAGSGTSLIEARRLGRNCIGVELQEHVAQGSRERLERVPNHSGVATEIHTGDSSAFDFVAALRRHGQPKADLALLHPPYHDIIKFSDDPQDLSNCDSIPIFLDRLGQVVENVSLALAEGGFLVLVIGDKYARGEWHPLGFQAMQVVQQQGFMLKSIVVKNFEETTGKRAQKELWRYRALAGGFFVFKHEYIFVFEKRGQDIPA